ncbi:MAG: hypothetical protein WBO46_00995 [Caldilineaceae bacterium]
MDLSWGSAAGLGIFLSGLGVMLWGLNCFIVAVGAVSSKKDE